MDVFFFKARNCFRKSTGISTERLSDLPVKTQLRMRFEGD